MRTGHADCSVKPRQGALRAAVRCLRHAGRPSWPSAPIACARLACRSHRQPVGGLLGAAPMEHRRRCPPASRWRGASSAARCARRLRRVRPSSHTAARRCCSASQGKRRGGASPRLRRRAQQCGRPLAASAVCSAVSHGRQRLPAGRTLLTVIATTALTLLLCNLDRICLSVAIVPIAREFGWAPGLQASALLLSAGPRVLRLLSGRAQRGVLLRAS